MASNFYDPDIRALPNGKRYQPSERLQNNDERSQKLKKARKLPYREEGAGQIAVEVGTGNKHILSEEGKEMLLRLLYFGHSPFHDLKCFCVCSYSSGRLWKFLF